LERAGQPFFVVDPGHAHSGSRVGAGLVNPVTGERWASPPNWAENAGQAREFYRELETAWGERFVTNFKIRRTWRDATEAAMVREKVARGALAPWVTSASLEPDAAWIDGAWRVALADLIAAGRQRWLGQGRLREAALTHAEAAAWPGPVVWCLGAAETRLPALRPIGGETLELAIGGPVLTPPGEQPTSSLAGWREDVVRHDGVWILPLGGGRAWAGASFLREEAERLARREALRTSVKKQLIDLEWLETAILPGRRMTTLDRRPLGAWLPGREGREGVFNGLGSKGALLGPGLASAWVHRLLTPCV